MNSSTSRNRYVLLATTTAAFATPFMATSINVALPAMGEEFHLSAVQLNWIVSSFLLTSAMFLLPFGRVADMLGRKRVFVAGIVVFSACSCACGLAPSGTMLIVFRLIQGIGASMIFGTSMAIVTSAFPPERRGHVLGINVAAVYLGACVGPTVGGVLTHQIGWRSIFFLNTLLGLITFFTASTHIPNDPPEHRGQRFDLAGGLLYGVSVAGIMYGVSTLKSGAHGAAIFGGGLATLVCFVVWELRYSSPLLDMRLFRNVSFAFSNLAALIHYCSTFAMALLLSLYLQVIRGYDAQFAGLILLVQPLVMAVLSPLAGRMSDRIEPRLLASSGMTLTCLGLGLFTLLSQETSMAFVVAVLLGVGFGYGLFSSPNSNAIMSSVPPKAFGVASSTLGTMRLVGQAFSMAIATFFFAVYLPDTQLDAASAPQLLRAIHIIFAVCTFLAATGIVASLARGRLRG